MEKKGKEAPCVTEVTCSRLYTEKKMNTVWIWCQILGWLLDHVEGSGMESEFSKYSKISNDNQKLWQKFVSNREPEPVPIDSFLIRSVSSLLFYL